MSIPKHIYTKYKRPGKILEVNTKPAVVETAGYITPQQQIMSFINAGRRLGDYRKEAYDARFDDDIDDIIPDPTRDPNFDLADASALLSNIGNQDAPAAGDEPAPAENNEPEPEPAE